MIDKLLDKLVDAAVAEGVLDEDSKSVVRYGLIYVYHVVSTAVAILLVGLAVNAPGIALAAAITGASFRFVSGGAHFDNSLLCLVFTASAYGFLAIVSKAIGSVISINPESFALVAAVGVGTALTFGIRIVDVYVPVDSANRPITTREEKDRFRLLSFSIVFIVAIAFITLGYFARAWDFAFAVWLAYCLQLFSLTAVGRKTITAVEGFFQRINRQRGAVSRQVV